MTHILLADIGGTNARFAVAEQGTAGAFRFAGATRTADHDGFAAAAKSIVGDVKFDAVALCVAGPVDNGKAHLTNAGWSLCQQEISTRFSRASCLMINDFAAQAHALACLGQDDWQPIGADIPADPSSPLVAIGPGTGLGVAVLTKASKQGVVISGEGGHVSLAARTEREWQVIDHLSRKFGHVSAERVISGDGLALLYQSLCHLDRGNEGDAKDGEAVIRLAQSGDLFAREARELFTAFLATVASDLAVTNGAFGGVYLAGGILPAWGDQFPAEVFRQRFEDKGRFADYLARIPTRLVTTPYAAFKGLLRALETA